MKTSLGVVSAALLLTGAAYVLPAHAQMSQPQPYGSYSTSAPTQPYGAPGWGQTQPYGTTGQMQPYGTTGQMQPYGTTSQTQPYGTTGQTQSYGTTGQPYGTTGQMQPYGTTGQMQPYGTTGQTQPYTGAQSYGVTTPTQPTGRTPGFSRTAGAIKRRASCRRERISVIARTPEPMKGR